MAHALLLPLDNRPCTSRFPLEIAAIAGFEVLSPPLALLGDVKKPAVLDGLETWLESQLVQVPLAVISLDTWLYGGLVFSRKSTVSLALLTERLQALAQLKARFPDLRLAAFATLLRLSNHNDATEERSYWAEYGERIFRYAWLEHALLADPDPDSSWHTEFQTLQSELPTDILLDYQGLRQRNLNLLFQALDAVQTEIFDYLYIGCDDSGTYGWNVQEKAQLAQAIAQKELGSQVLLYPGADELASALLMRALIPQTFSVALEYTFPESAHLPTLYEGQPLMQTLQAQALAAGVIVRGDAPAQAVLWLHNPPQLQFDQYLDRVSRQPLDSADYLRLGKAIKASALPVAVADLCYANGGDHGLLMAFEEQALLPLIKGYSAWNTCGNTLGFAFAWLKAWLHSQTPGCATEALQTRFLLERLLDDGWYQGVMRQRLCQHYSEPVTLDSCLRLLAFCNERLQLWHEAFAEQGWSAAEIRQLHFPWRRFFEISLAVCLKK
ncbi:MAG: DUF4127 family protein [Candidatus Sericytochromatia bacterium]|nr:DUF4127 family protein [Candidatus Sericytochromatia bacterium]